MFKFTKISAYFINFFRQQALQGQKEAFEQEKVKAKRVPGARPIKPDLDLKIVNIGSLLQLSNIDLIYGSLWFRHVIGKQKKSEKTLDEYMGGIEFFNQLLLLSKDMGSVRNEKMKKNSDILQVKIFNLDMVRLCHYGLCEFEFNKHRESQLKILISFTKTVLDMLDKYSQGKQLKISTNKKKVVKVKKDSGFDDEEFDDEEHREVNVERSFNYVSEISSLVDYKVINKLMGYVYMKCKNEEEPLLTDQIASIFSRVIRQIKAVWIFYQLSYMDTIERFMLKYRKDLKHHALSKIFSEILSSFFSLAKTNKLLSLEIMFQIPNRATKDQILNNYESGSLNSIEMNETYAEEQLPDEEYLQPINKRARTKPKKENYKAALKTFIKLHQGAILDKGTIMKCIKFLLGRFQDYIQFESMREEIGGSDPCIDSINFTIVPYSADEFDLL